MKKALVNPHGNIMQIATAEFPVHSGFVWVDVPDDTTTRDTFVNGAVVKEPAPDAPADQSNSDMLYPQLRAVLIAAGAMAGKTPAEAKAAYKTAFDSL
jgi:penicillin V acylase-like amidase (Ntn superfamily)